MVSMPSPQSRLFVLTNDPRKGPQDQAEQGAYYGIYNENNGPSCSQDYSKGYFKDDHRSIICVSPLPFQLVSCSRIPRTKVIGS